jgi:ATP-dependent Clp protease adaptor protein ClpS
MAVVGDPGVRAFDVHRGLDTISGEIMPKTWEEADGGVAVEKETQHKIDKPRLWKVMLHNDNYTTMDFVVNVLVSVFRKSEGEAVRIMLDVHYKGLGIVGVYPREVAETKVARVLQLAQEAQFPLLCTMERE